ncbi:MAG TPA: V4R domain-containing protein [Ureibacillus sp.]|nr:V4R domain-containing protein [Ureibacillus sp.]
MSSGIKQTFGPSHGMLISPGSFSTLKRTLLENIGTDKTRSFLFRFGYDIGISAAISKAPHKDPANNRGKNSMHAMYGQVRDVIINPDFEQLLNGTISKITGKWIDSFEADVHLKYFERATECVCYTLCGYVNGFLWHKFRSPLVTIETKCKAKGDPCCEFEIRLEENWMPEREDIIKIYHDSAFANEVDMTYDALLNHKHLVDKLSTFSSKLTQSVTERHSMKQILQTAYEHLGIPILIEDLHDEEILQIGLNEEQLLRIYKDRKKLTYVQSTLDTKYFEGKSYNKLVAPVLINKSPYANCSFVYLSGKELDENDHLFLERIANVTALCFLYEEAQYEELDRLSHTILDRLSRQQYQTIKDIEPYFKLYPFKIKPPFHTISLAITNAMNAEKADLQEHLQYFSKYFNKYSISAIFSTIGEDIVFLMMQQDKDFVPQLLFIIETIQERNQDLVYTLGISNRFEDLTTFTNSLKEAKLAQKFPNKSNFTHYRELGILGQFVSSLQPTQLHEIAKDMLQELYDFEDLRKKELLYSLHKYLINGQKLKETMADLALSLGGLQYRIRQIEALLKKSLKDAPYTSYLLLIIEALLLTNELDFKEFE